MVEDDGFERVYQLHGPTVLRYCLYSLGSRTDAEDVAAEAFARYMERGARVPDARAEAWLIKVAKNLCASHHRHAARDRRIVERLAAVAPTDCSWNDPDWWSGVETLSEPERLAVFLRLVQDLPFREVARVMGKREGSAKMVFYRAVEKLKGAYAEYAPGSTTQFVGGVSNE